MDTRGDCVLGTSKGVRIGVFEDTAGVGLDKSGVNTDISVE